MLAFHVFLLHSLCMEEWVVLGAASSSAWSEGLIKIISVFDYVLGASLGLDTSNIASESLLQVSLFHFVLHAELTVVLMNVMAAFLPSAMLVHR